MFGWLCCPRLMTGIANAFCFIACMRLASAWFAPSKLALVTGLIVTLGMLGGLVAQTPAVMLAQTYGWRETMVFNAILGAVVFGLIFLFVQDSPIPMQRRQSTRQTTEADEVTIGLWQGLRLAMANSQNWLAGTYTALLNLPVILLGALWSSLYLIQRYGLTQAQAANVTSMIFLGIIVGSPLAGLISDKMVSRKRPMIIGGLFSLLAVLMVLYVKGMTYHQLISLFFVLGLVTSAQVISYPLVTESNSLSINSTAMGFASVLIMGGAAVSQDVSGWLLDWHWNGVMAHGAPVYTTADYRFALMILPVTFVVAVFCSLLVKDSQCARLVD